MSDYGGTGGGDHLDNDKGGHLTVKKKLSANGMNIMKKKQISDYQINVEPIGKPSH